MKSPAAVLIAIACFTAAAAEPPDSWVDPDTGHRIVRLTREPGSASLYFNQNGYMADGRRMVYTTPDGISVLDLETHTAKVVVEGRAQVIVAGQKTPQVYYLKDGAAWAANVDTGATHKIADLPPRASVATVNADETLLAGTYIEGAGRDYARSAADQQIHPLDQAANKGQMMEERFAARLPMGLFVIDIQTGQTKTILHSTDWLGHLLFSPTDPSLLMFCHEGPWHKLDRIWTIHTDGSHLTKIHARTMEMEIAGHEFWSQDGKTIWYDLQTPRGEDFWLAGYKVDTGERIQYHLQRNEWSIHFNVSRDGTLFCGDGGDPGQVAHAPDGRWLYLFRPQLEKNLGVADKSFIRPGVLHAERLVNMSKHRYRLEPNVSFTPDQKWVVFRSNMFGASYAFAVEVAKAAPAYDLTGTTDLHTHGYPDTMARSIDAIDLAKLARDRGMRAIVLKNHYEPTAGLAYEARHIVPGIDVFGGITLNRAVGGINLEAVEHMANLSGGWGRVVWMPTMDAENQVRANRENRPFVAISRGGALLPEVREMLALIAKHHLILATGHSSPEEDLMLVREGRRAGVEQIIVTHASIPPVSMSIAQMKEAAAEGAYLEFVYHGLLPPSQVRLADYIAAIRAVGTEHCVLASDLGRQGDPLHPDGLQEFLHQLHEAGFTPAELDVMVKTNPARILGLGTR